MRRPTEKDYPKGEGIGNCRKNFRNEEAKVNKKNLEAEKKRQREMERQAAAFEQSLNEYGTVQTNMQMEIERLKAIPEKITVLFLAANPKDTPKLSLDEEARSIQEKIRLSEYRDSIRFESRWATRSSDILQAINETNPTIVHFSGHESTSGELAFNILAVCIRVEWLLLRLLQQRKHLTFQKCVASD